MTSSHKSAFDCKKYSHIGIIDELCNEYDDMDNTKIKLLMHNFNFANTNIRNKIALKEKIINYLIKNSKDYLK